MIENVVETSVDAVVDRPRAAIERLPVIANLQQLGALLAAYAGGGVASALSALQTDAPTWASLGGDDGGAAWNLARRLGIPLVALDEVSVAEAYRVRAD